MTQVPLTLAEMLQELTPTEIIQILSLSEMIHGRTPGEMIQGLMPAERDVVLAKLRNQAQSSLPPLTLADWIQVHTPFAMPKLPKLPSGLASLSAPYSTSSRLLLMGACFGVGAWYLKN